MVETRKSRQERERIDLVMKGTEKEDRLVLTPKEFVELSCMCDN